MTTDRELQRLLDRWFDEGPNEVADRVIDDVADRIDHVPQRPAWRLPWRHPMNPLLKLGAAVAAILVVAVAGVGLLRIVPGGVGGPPAATPLPGSAASPSPAPSNSASPSRAPALMEVQGTSISWTAFVPTGWAGIGGWALTTSEGFAGPTGIGIAATGAVHVPSDPCDGVGEPSEGASVADVVAALEARDDLTVTNPTDVRLGGYSGTRVEIALPADLSACDGSYIVFAEPDGSGFYAQGPSNRLRTWIIDVEGRPIVFQIESFADTPTEDLAEAQAIVDSIEITP